MTYYTSVILLTWFTLVLGEIPMVVRGVLGSQHFMRNRALHYLGQLMVKSYI